jgi:hypothetical protein
MSRGYNVIFACVDPKKYPLVSCFIKSYSILFVYPMHLPLRLLPRQKLIQDGNILLQALQPLLQLGLHLCVVITELLVEILSVGCGAHGCTEDWLHDERVVGLECVAVGIAE